MASQYGIHLREYWRFLKKRKAKEDVEKILGSRVLGVIPHADSREIHGSPDELQPEGIKDNGKIETAHLITHLFPKSMVAASFRGLRTNLQFKNAEKPLKVISVTSASAQEGKTLISINLAIIMAQAGMKTLLVGSDMRTPMIDRAFGVEITPGLSDFLLANYPWRDTVKTITDLIMGEMSLDDVMLTPGLDNLNIITSGAIPPDPAVLIESKRLKDFIDEVKNEYDFVIFDSPPVLSTADAAVLGAGMDGVLLVYRVGSVSRGLLKRAAAQLEQVKCPLLGVILNGTKPEFSPGFEDVGHHKYDDFCGDEEKECRGKEGTGILPFLERKDLRKKRAGVTSGNAPTEKIGKKVNLRKWFLLFIAVALLCIGVPWQNHVFSPSKTIHIDKDKNDTKTIPLVRQPVSYPKKINAVQKSMEPEIGPIAQPAPPDAGESQPPQNIAVSGNDNKDMNGSPTGTTYPYAVYLGSFRTIKRVKKAVEIYGKRGLSTYWVPVEFREIGKWYRLYSGHFADRIHADQFIRENDLQEAEVKNTRYAILLGIFSDRREMVDKMEELKNLDYSPYVIPQGENGYRLLVGAYFKRNFAMKLQQKLKDHGFQNQVIER